MSALALFLFSFLSKINILISISTPIWQQHPNASGLLFLPPKTVRERFHVCSGSPSPFRFKTWLLLQNTSGVIVFGLFSRRFKIIELAMDMSVPACSLFSFLCIEASKFISVLQKDLKETDVFLSALEKAYPKIPG
jgi:hypothetical protein